MPAKADIVAQRTFFKTILNPLMKQAKQKKIVLLFLDASHFVMGCDFLGYIYGATRRFVKTSSGRQRYNVLGALNFLSKKLTTVTNDTYITATEICDMLEKLAVEYAGKPIHLILDNARYQRCATVQELAAKLKITLVYIPPYSPNLNLIERMWKFVKSNLQTKYYESFNIFKERIDSIISSSYKENKKAIANLISGKVQLFDDLVAIDNNTFAPSQSIKKRTA